MGGWSGIVWVSDSVVRELTLFAATGFLIGGADDLAIDLVYFFRHLFTLLRAKGRRRLPTLADFPPQASSGRIAVFVAAWDESAVIGAMLRTALARFEHPDYRLYVGVYPNDRATIDAVAAVAEHDPRVRMVIGSVAGPTTKAGCLNTLWRTLQRDAQTERWVPKAVVLHDAEDVVHAAELAIFDRLIDRHWVVQLPVLPLVDRGSRLVSGHYCDEFAESHAKQMVVRGAIGAGMPLAGVGCAIHYHALMAIAAERDDRPFDDASLTEDYELGLGIAARGGSGAFARVATCRGGPVVAVRAYFPGTLEAAVRQKTRWMIGIALAGWDRTGWGRWSHWSEHWMRMRDRRAPLAVLVLGTAYLAIILWAGTAVLHYLTGTARPPTSPGMRLVLSVNAGLLCWRLMMRAAFTRLSYGWAEALLAVPRAVVGNLISLLAARRALVRYVRMLGGGALDWDKTAHSFPLDLAGVAER